MDLPLSHLCQANESIGILVINKKIRYDEFKQLCDDVKGKLPVITSEAEENIKRAELQDQLYEDQELGDCVINKRYREYKPLSW